MEGWLFIWPMGGLVVYMTNNGKEGKLVILTNGRAGRLSGK